MFFLLKTLMKLRRFIVAPYDMPPDAVALELP